MKCQSVHSALLGSEKPSRLPADVVAHLRGCAPCRVWQRRLAHLDRKVSLLAALADAIQNDTRALFDAAGPEDLATLAGCYQKVVSDGIVKQAQALPAGDRTEFLNSLAPRLAAAADDAERLARVRPDTTTG